MLISRLSPPSQLLADDVLAEWKGESMVDEDIVCCIAPTDQSAPFLQLVQVRLESLRPVWTCARAHHPLFFRRLSMHWPLSTKEQPRLESKVSECAWCHNRSAFSSPHITASNAIVIATEKRPPSPLVDDSFLEKVSIVCPNIGIVYSGMGPDFRVLLAKARKSAQAYWKIYGEYPPTRVLVQEVATIMQEATQSG